MRLLPVLLLLVSTSAPAQECPAKLIDIERQVGAATSAFAGLDVDAFLEAMDALNFDLTCLEEPLSPQTAAHIHRANGIRLFVGGEQQNAAESLAAARHLEPDYVFPESLVPTGHPIRQLHDEVDPTQEHSLSVPPPRVGHLAFDGIRGVQRPAGRATIFQNFDGEGTSVNTTYLFAKTPLPAYSAAENFVPEGVHPELGWDPDGQPLPPPVKPEKNRPKKEANYNKPLFFGMIGGGVLAVGLYGGAVASEAHFKSTSWAFDPYSDEAAGLRSRTNTLFVGSMVMGGLAAGAGVGAFTIQGQF